MMSVYINVGGELSKDSNGLFLEEESNEEK